MPLFDRMYSIKAIVEEYMDTDTLIMYLLLIISCFETIIRFILFILTVYALISTIKINNRIRKFTKAGKQFVKEHYPELSKKRFTVSLFEYR